MKILKNYIVLAAAVLLLMAGLTGCGNGENKVIADLTVPTESEIVMETVETTVVTTEAVTEPTEETAEPTTEATEMPTEPESKGIRGVVISTNSLNVRNAPGVRNELVAKLPRGTKVTVYETVTVDGALWGRIDEGWVSMEYIKLDGDIHTPTEEYPSEPKEETTIPTEPEHIHAYTETVTKPTCTQDGFTTYTCKCGDTYKDNYVNSLGHKWSQWKTTKEPTEAAEGKAERTCSNCGDKETKSLPKLIPNHTHKYTEKVTKEPTCTASGTKTYTCSCGDSYTESIPQTAHSYTHKTVTATCTARGYTEHTCKNCGTSYKDSYTNANGHSYQCTETAPTCNQDGKKVYTCSVCKDSYTQTIPRTGHDYKVTEKKPTCTEAGSKTSVCSKCGDTSTEKIPATGHKWSGWVTEKEPTVTSTGLKVRTCSACGKRETQVIDKLPPKPPEPSTPTEPEKPAVCNHAYTVTSQTAATCTTAGSNTFKCTQCGDTKTETIPATGHSWGKWVTIKEPTETANGSKSRLCFYCGKQETQTIDKLPSTPTKPTEPPVKPTEPEKPAPCNHNYTLTSQVAATCTESGRKNYVCSKCGETKTETVNPIGHNWVHHQDEVGHWNFRISCHCGWSTTSSDYVSAFRAHVNSVDDPYNHSYYESSTWVVDTPAKDWDTCSICGATK